MHPTLLALILGMTVLTTPTTALSDDGVAKTQAGDLSLTGAFIRATLPNAPVGAGYVTITNAGLQDDRLLSVSASVADKLVVHEMAHENNIASMRTLPDGLLVPAQTTVSLTPGASHIMIIGLEEQLKEGQSVDLTLTFEVRGDVTVPFDVLALNARSHPDAVTAELPE